MNCSHCGRIAPPNKETCLYCGEKIDRSFEDLVISCPACANEMEKRTVEEVVIDHCADCNGVWLDKSELEQLAQKFVSPERIQPAGESAKKSNRNQTGHPYRKCPRCKQLMLVKNYKKSGVMIDVCGYHGLFFDDGEVSRAIKMVNALTIQESSKKKTSVQRQSVSLYSTKNRTRSYPQTGLLELFNLFWG